MFTEKDYIRHFGLTVTVLIKYTRKKLSDAPPEFYLVIIWYSANVYKNDSII